MAIGSSPKFNVGTPKLNTPDTSKMKSSYIWKTLDPTNKMYKKVGMNPGQVATTTTSPGTPGDKANSKLSVRDWYKKPSAGSGDELGDITKGAEDLHEYTKNANKALDGADTDHFTKMNTAGSDYLKTLGTLGTRYNEDITKLGEQAKNQATNAQNTYDNTIAPAAKTMLDADMAEAGNAMSLEEAGDPNNRIHQAVRHMYNEQAYNVGRQGQQSSAVLGALGAQNAASAFGSMGPMSVGQQQALYAASQGQAGQAYARAQQEMSRLRQQGIDTGFEQSDIQYQRGERAKGRAKDALGQVSDLQGVNLEQQAALRGEQGRIHADILGVNQNYNAENRAFQEIMAGLGQANIYNTQNRGIATENQKFGIDTGVSSAKAMQKNAQNSGMAHILGGIGALGGGILGYKYGGAPGAVAGVGAGQQLGQGVGAMAAPQQAPYQSPNTYQGVNPYSNPGQGSPYQPYQARAYA